MALALASCGHLRPEAAVRRPAVTTLAPSRGEPTQPLAHDRQRAAPEPSASPADSGAVACCTKFLPGRVLGIVESPAITEISGIAASRVNPDVVYVHNDSGDRARFYALDGAARLVGVYELAGANLVDCEDIAAADGYLYLADIGDNAVRIGAGSGRHSVFVYRVREPIITSRAAATDHSTTDDSSTDSINDARGVHLLEGWTLLELFYPDRAHDAESLMVDPASKSLLLVTKEDHGPSLVFRAALDANSPTRLERVAQIPFGTEQAPGHYYATAGDISAQGNAVLMRTYGSVLLFPRRPGEAWSRTFGRPAIVMPSRFEPQGEAVAFSADGSGYFTVSESKRQPLFYYPASTECREAAQRARPGG